MTRKVIFDMEIESMTDLQEAIHVAERSLSRDGVRTVIRIEEYD